MDRHLTEEISITNLVDLDQLQRVQDQFSEATDLAIIAVDYRGNPVTQSHGFTPFCALMRMDPARRRLCHSCDAHGGLQAAIEGRPHIYRCHAG
ncbi:MAG: PocR ligand-binding domain-containing protein, partial [Propionicimonas sp.]